MALVTILGGVLLARPAGAQSEITVFSAPGGRHAFQDFGEDGRLRLGDRLTARFPLTDATGESALGKGHLDCVVQRQITDGPEGPGGHLPL